MLQVLRKDGLDRFAVRNDRLAATATITNAQVDLSGGMLTLTLKGFGFGPLQRSDGSALPAGDYLVAVNPNAGPL